MNDEYLWQKTGADPETKRLEDALIVFRYREAQPPLVVDRAADTDRSRWWNFIALGAPALAALVVAAGLWFQSSALNKDDEITFVYYPAASVEEAAPAPENLPVSPTPRSQPPRTMRFHVQSASANRRPEKKSEPKNRTPVLTAQERRAYDQLMLALAISSSKLNIVRDTINGVGDEKEIHKSNNR